MIISLALLAWTRLRAVRHAMGSSHSHYTYEGDGVSITQKRRGRAAGSPPTSSLGCCIVALPAWGNAVGIEGVSHYLARLPPCDGIAPAEVRTVLLVTRLVWHRPTRVAGHHTQVGEAHDLGVEGIVLLHVGVEDATGRARETRCVGHYLGELS